MPEVRVQLPLSALWLCFGGGRIGKITFGVWESLEIRLVRGQETVGSNPITPTRRKQPGCSKGVGSETQEFRRLCGAQPGCGVVRE